MAKIVWSRLGSEDSKHTIQAALRSLLDQVDSAKRGYDDIRSQVKQNLTILFHELAYHEDLFTLLAERVTVLGNNSAQGIFLKAGERGLVLLNHEKQIKVYASAGSTPDSECEGEVDLDFLVEYYGDTEILALIVNRVTQQVRDFKRVTDAHGRWKHTLQELGAGIFPASE